MEDIVRKVRKTYQNEFNDFIKEDFEFHRGWKLFDYRDIISDEFLTICELKKGSPSCGVIRSDFDHISIAREYEDAGAGAISVLTEKDHFYGDPKYLSEVKYVVDLPVLRKDFLVHPYQIYQSYNMGADMVLLICSCLSDDDLIELSQEARYLGMTPLVEVHNEDELERALDLEGDHILGINNRDLVTFKVDLERSFELKQSVPHNVPVISESGIASYDDICRLKEKGFSGALIGEALMREKSPGKALRRMLSG